MDELEFQASMDRIVTSFIRNLAGRLIERQTRIETFISIQAQLLTDTEIAALVSQTGVVAINTEAMIADAVRLYEQSIAAAAQSGVADIQARLGAEKEWTWQTESGRPCPDCSARNGQTHSYEYWETVGLPKTGATICGAWCLCRLVESA
jgi:hypothetical protein